MIVYQNTKFTKTSDGEFVPGEAITEEGSSLVFKLHNGKNMLGLSTGAAGEVFAGFSISRAMPPGFMPAVEEGVIEGGSFSLQRTPDSAQILIKIDGAAVDSGDVSVGSTAPASAGLVAIDGSELLFNSGDDDKTVTVQYHYEPTVAEARSYNGDGPIGGDPAAEMGRVGRVTQASPISLTNFDASADWSGVVHPSLGADGLLTVGGTGTELTNFVVLEAPSAASAYLTLEYVG